MDTIPCMHPANVVCRALLAGLPLYILKTISNSVNPALGGKRMLLLLLKNRNNYYLKVLHYSNMHIVLTCEVATKSYWEEKRERHWAVPYVHATR
jgi:hypothetical protein